MNVTTLLEYKQMFKSYYIRYETFIRYAARFLLSLICFSLINGRIGYYERFSHFIFTFGFTVLGTVLPTGFTAFFCAMLILLHLYALSLESCAMAFVLFLCIYLLYYRLAPHDAYVLLLTPVLFALHIPCVMPFMAGILLNPVSVISMSFGVVVWFFLHSVAQSADPASGVAAENIQEQAEETIGRIQGIVGTLTSDKTMIVYIAAFAVAALLICFIRRQPVKHAWMIAIGAGAFANLLILLIGDVVLDADVGIAGAFLGTLLGAAAGLVVMFFSFSPDYSRIEQVQFEDDEYYYYVKAIPKIALGERRFSSKSINRALHGHVVAEDTPEGALEIETIKERPAAPAQQKTDTPHAQKHNAHANGKKAQGGDHRKTGNSKGKTGRK